MLVDLGDVVPLAVQVTDATGTNADAGAITCTLTAPDGTTSTLATARTAAGRYTTTATPTLPGRHTVRWVATGANASAYTDTFTVIDPASLGVVGLPDLKSHLDITGTADDDELRAVILAASDAIGANLHRPVRRESRSRTWVTVRGTGQTLVLPQSDVASIDSVTAAGTALAATDYVADLNTGVLYRAAGWIPPVTVTWTTRPVDSADIRQAVLEMCRHLWDTQRGTSRALPRSGEITTTGTGYSLPYRVTELLAPYRSRA